MNNDDTFKTNDNNPPALTPELEARVVAWVLGEASPFEAAELERLCAEQPELTVFKRRIEAVHGLVGEAAKPVSEPLRLSPERRARVLALIGAADAPTMGLGKAVEPVVKQARRRKATHWVKAWQTWGLPIAACLTLGLFLAAAMTPAFQKVRFSAERPKRPDPSATVLGPAFEQPQPEVVDASPHVVFSMPTQPSGAMASSSSTSDKFAFAQNKPAASMPMPLEENAAGAKQQAQLADRSRPQPVSSPELSVVAAPAAAPAAPRQELAYGGETKTTAGTLSLKGANTYTGGTSSQLNGRVMIEKEISQDESGRDVGQLMNSSVSSGTGVGSRSAAAVRDSDIDAQAQREAGAVQSDGYFSTSQPVSRLESIASEVRRRRQIRPDPDSADVTVGGFGGGSGMVADEKAKDELSAKGRSQYLAGDISGAEQTFKALESAAPESPEAHSFLGRIEKDKSAVAQLNREKTRGQMVEEVSKSWQRPGVYQDTVKAGAWKPQILGAGRERDDNSGITITAGTPQKFTIFELTDDDKKEIERRVAKRKMEHSALGVAAKVDEQSAKIAAHMGYDLDWFAARNEVIAEIKTAEKQAAEADLGTSKPDIKASAVLIESFRVENPAATEAISTFSLHVSDASFRLAKAALARGEAPDSTTIRPEEFYNAFDYGDPAPVAGEPVACRIEQAAHPFLQQRNLVRIAMKVPAAGRGAGTPLRLTVLLDTSGSMEREDRAASVRAAFTALASLLGPNDRVTLIGFARTPRLLAESVAGDQAAKLIELAARTPAEGGTNLEEALALAGKLAMRQKTTGAQNRIVLLTDGAANLGDADPQQLARRVESLRQKGIAFDACGVVADGLDDSVLEALTRKGDGRYAIINSPEEADAAFARQLAGAFRPAAKDVKVQVRFNPARVARYRLIGFEQHRLKTEDFRNDAVDAAELAAEEAAVAVYQVEVRPEGEGELGEVSVRFLDTRTNERVERAWTLAYAAQPTAFARTTPSMQLAGSAAFLAEKLRGGALAGQIRLEEFAPVVEGLGAAYPNAVRVREFIEMFRQTRRLTGE